MKTLLLLFMFTFSASASAAWTFPDKSPDVAADSAALSTRWNAILLEGKGYVSTTLSASAKLPTVTFPAMNKTYTMDLDKYAGQVQIVGTIVIFCGLLLSVFILFS